MNGNRSYGFSKENGTDCSLAFLLKRSVLVVIAIALAIGLVGCSLDDLLSPFAGDIPFEQNPTVSPDMGAVDDTPTVPDMDLPLDDVDFRPL